MRTAGPCFAVLNTIGRQTTISIEYGVQNTTPETASPSLAYNVVAEAKSRLCNEHSTA